MSTTTNTIDTKLLSFTQLFGQKIGPLTIDTIEIPLIQRDYAQGRAGVERIRSQFVDSVCTALLPNAKSIELDFVYGDVENGKFMPLDGQQRLTLLFLLHCYLAWHQPAQANPPPWAKFSYATRPGAREFCRMLSHCRPHFDTNNSTNPLSSWLIDQADYLPTWNHDPTIRSMLVVLDELHQWFTERSVNVDSAWKKLTDTENPAIRFHLLPMTADGTTNPQYIKMNSRGKPLTPFENFKAQFEEKLEAINASKAKDFAKKMDTDWSDILWEYRGDDNLVDDEFMRYFRFISEVCAWNSGASLVNNKKINDLAYISDLAEKVYGASQVKSEENLNFLFHSFDIWHGKHIKDECETLLTATSSPDIQRLLLFNAFRKEGVDLFHACCRYYGTSEWGLRRTLLFYGLLLRWNFPKQDIEITNFSTHLRTLRNLIEASGDGEIREEFMPRLLADVRFVMSGNIDEVSSFNQEQKQNELDKLALLETDPTLATILYQLEDHELLRGGLTAFDLNPSKFQVRTQTFLNVFDKSTYNNHAPWMDITGALLAHGCYAKTQNRWTGYHFADLGASQNNESWRILFRGKGKGATIHPLKQPLMALLDALSTGSTLRDESQQYLNDCNTTKDWRYYLVKYTAMRRGESGRYAFNINGYEACMLRKDQMNSYHADPYLCAIVEVSGIPYEAIANPNWPNSFYGYETNPRWLYLKKSGIKLRSVDAGWEISDIPLTQQTVWQQVMQSIQGITVTENPTNTTLLIAVEKNGEVDTVDRIEIGANLLKTLVTHGL
jgi:hypothetical protein